jgi:hypothetical protein
MRARIVRLPIQRGVRGMGQASFCDPSFVGPLTADQQTICNLQAGVDYRDALLQQQGGGSSFSLASVPTWAWLVGAGLFSIAVMSGGRRR